MNRIVPEVRIRRFNEDWEERNLEEVITVVGGATPSKSNPKYWNGPIVWLSSKEIKEKYVSEGTHTITKKAVDDNTTKIIKSGTPLIVSRSGILARLFPISIPTKDVAINQDIKALIFDNNIINTNFFVAQLQKNEKYILKSIVKTGTTVQSVNMPDFYKLKLFLPSKKEQEKTGNFFQVLDEIITLQQQLLNDHKQLKKAMLQKMFPKNGEIAPKIRFSGFTDDWKRCKLGDYLTIPEKKVKNVKNINELITLKLNLQGMYNGSNRATLELGATRYYERKAGQFLYGKQNFFNGSMGIIPTELDRKATSGDVPALDINNINSDYLYTYVSRPSYWKAKESQSSGTGSKRIHEKTLQKFDISVPTIDEQKKIGKFFKQLDETIELHQNKLETYQELKKAMLQKMFV